MSWEKMILARQDDYTSDDCYYCEYKTDCQNQCMKIDEIYNPVICKLLERMDF